MDPVHFGIPQSPVIFLHLLLFWSGWKQTRTCLLLVQCLCTQVFFSVPSRMLKM